jgi:hypothetical protein
MFFALDGTGVQSHHRRSALAVIFGRPVAFTSKCLP